jgi:dUTP pyrophosphatase
MKVKKLHKDAILPHYATEGASCFDIFCYEKPIWTLSGTRWITTIRTGLAVEIPHEHALIMYSRSGHGFNHLTTLANGTGVIDYDYRGEIKVKLISHSGGHPDIKKGDAVAQGCIINTPRTYFMEVDDLSFTERGEKGFGSSDKDVK